MNHIRFTQVPEALEYPASIRSKLSTLHSQVVAYVVSNFKGTMKYKSRCLGLLNSLSYQVMSGEFQESAWAGEKSISAFLASDSILPTDDELMAVTGKTFIHSKQVIWDVEESETLGQERKDEEDAVAAKRPIIPAVSVEVNHIQMSTPRIPSAKEDLYIQPPTTPQFDVRKPWLSTYIGNTRYVIYTSIPEVPKVQSQISATTDVAKMTRIDLMNLFPDKVIQTRSQTFYDKSLPFEYEENIGLIFPILDFSASDIRDNIIKYPHFFKLQRIVDNKAVLFYHNIEIDGELQNSLDYWDSNPDLKQLPRNSEFIKEYVVRRYLLERDILKIEHKYPIFGSLEPYLTLYMPAAEYAKLGVKESAESLAMQCVRARMRYKQTRNPIIRAVYHDHE